MQEVYGVLRGLFVMHENMCIRAWTCSFENEETASQLLALTEFSVLQDFILYELQLDFM